MRGAAWLTVPLAGAGVPLVQETEPRIRAGWIPGELLLPLKEELGRGVVSAPDGGTPVQTRDPDGRSGAG